MCIRLLQGALLVRLVKGQELPAKDGTTSDPFCTFKLGKHKEQKSYVISATLQPTWNQKFEWLNVSSAGVAPAMWLLLIIVTSNRISGFLIVPKE
jgi:C2 domain